MAAARSLPLRPPGHRDLRESIEILRFLVHKELKVKYKRSVLGLLWSLITPLAFTVIYLFVFVYVYPVGQDGFILFLLAGLLPWQYFNMATIAGTNAIVDNGGLVSKVAFPRALLPVAVVLANLINFLIGYAIFLLALLATGRDLWLRLHWVLLAICLQTILTIGVTLALSVWNVYLRDIRQMISILMTAAFFLTPIVYDFEQVPERFRGYLLANPLAAVMTLYHDAVFHCRDPEPSVVVIGSLQVLAALAIGLVAFRRLAPDIAKEV